MIIKYATLPKPLVRASQIYSPEQLKQHEHRPTDKLLSDGSRDKRLEQQWVNNPESLLVTTSFEDLIKINNKAVGIVHGLCNPPLVTIDIDCQHKADILMPIVNNLPTSQQPLVISKGVGKAGYHLLYHNTQENKLLLDYILAVNKGGLGDQLDVLQSSSKILFFGNEGNKTKEHIAINPLVVNGNPNNIVIPIPIQLQLAVMALFKDIRPQHLNIAKESGTFLPEHSLQVSDLGYLFKDFNPQNADTEITLATFIAKRAKVDLKEQFQNQSEEEAYPYKPKYYTGTPNDLLHRLSGSLKNDVGVSQEQHKTVIETINQQLHHKKNLDDLQKEILMPDTRNTTEHPYTYNKDWEENTASIFSNHKQLLNIYRVSRSSSQEPHMIHNTETGSVSLFRTPTELVEELQGEVALPAKKLRSIQSRAQLVDLIDRPDEPFGLIQPKKDSVNRRPSFNVYRRTLIQDFFYTPEEAQLITKHIYKRPATIIAAIESQMGVDKTHELFLPFLRHKLLTHEPSALVFVLVGVPYSFKTGLMEGVIKPLFSTQRYNKVGGEVLTEKFNDWLVNLDILYIDEFHHLTGTPQLKPAIQALNKLGSEYHEGIRSMHKSVQKGKDIKQEATVFLAMNNQHLVVPATETTGERRLVVGYSRQPLSVALKMADPDIKALIKSEINDFAIYLRKEVGEIDPQDYAHNRRWKDIDNHYFSFMDEGISKLKRLAQALGLTNDAPNFEQLQKLADPIPLKNFVFKLQRTSHGSPYRLRLWNAQGSYSNQITQEGLIDHIESIDYNDVAKALSNNDKALKPSMVSSNIRQMKQDFILSEAEVLVNNLYQEPEEVMKLDGGTR